jgi:hypothetical protein
MTLFKLVKAFAIIIDNPGRLFYKNAWPDGQQSLIPTGYGNPNGGAVWRMINKAAD